MTKESPELLLSGKKKVFFFFILFLLPLFFFLFLETGLRIFHYGLDLRLFKMSSSYPSYFEVNNQVAKRFFSKMDGTAPSNDIFLINKPDSCYRIFVMGCSTTRGFPYEMGVTFTRILNYRLKDAFPHKQIEVINTAMAAVNSYTQADFIDEILAQKPDAILIYTGHNEYYGALGVGSVEGGGNARWLKKLHLKLIRLRTYQLIQNLINRMSKTIADSKNLPKGTLMERIVKNKAIEYKSDTYNKGLEQFNMNMREVITKAREANIPIILSDLVSNIKDMKPFKSIKSKFNPYAQDVYDEAKKFEISNDFEKAKIAFYRAKDLDAIRFRAPEDMNKIIYQIGKDFNIPILGMQKVFESNSPNGLIGNNLMIEHLHPNINGYFLMADAFFNILKQQKFISQNWDTTLIKPSQYYRNNWGFTELDSLVADLSIKKLKAGWPFQPESFVNNFKLTYKPKSDVDSIALMCIKYENVNITDKHLDLAKLFAAKGENIKAFNEMNSLIKSYPFLAQYYLQGAEYLLAANQKDKALEILESFPYLNTNFLTLINFGIIYQNAGLIQKALSCYEKARANAKDEDNIEYVLTLLYKLYKETDNITKLNEILTEIRKKKPDFDIESASKKQEVLVVIDKEIKSYIEKALALAKLNKLDEALELLQKSLKIKESAFANQMIGSIYYQKKDSRALQYLEKAYSQNPKDENTLNNLFVIYIMNKDFTKATKCLNELKAVSTNTIRIQKLSNYLNQAMK